MKNKLVWEVWKNPLNDIVDLDNNGEEQLTDYEKSEMMAENGGLKMIFTPFGALPLKKHLAENPFNMWIGHTNFYITKSIAELIANTPGVESLQIGSPYRFIIGVAKLFNTAKVKSEVQTKLNIVIEKPTVEIQDTIDKVSNYKYWAVFVLPNKQVNIVYTDKDDDANYLNTLNTYKEASDGVGGQLYTNNEFEN